MHGSSVNSAVLHCSWQQCICHSDRHTLSCANAAVLSRVNPAVPASGSTVPRRLGSARGRRSVVKLFSLSCSQRVHQQHMASKALASPLYLSWRDQFFSACCWADPFFDGPSCVNSGCVVSSPWWMWHFRPHPGPSGRQYPRRTRGH